MRAPFRVLLSSSPLHCPIIDKGHTTSVPPPEDPPPCLGSSVVSPCSAGAGFELTISTTSRPSDPRTVYGSRCGIDELDPGLPPPRHLPLSLAGMLLAWCFLELRLKAWRGCISFSVGSKSESSPSSLASISTQSSSSDYIGRSEAQQRTVHE